MTEFQFLENLEFYQHRFEKLYQKIVRDMSLYIRKNPVYDSKFFKTILNYSINITLTADWIRLLKDFNSDKYINILRFSTDFNHSTDMPDAIKKSAAAIKMIVTQMIRDRLQPRSHQIA